MTEQQQRYISIVEQSIADLYINMDTKLDEHGIGDTIDADTITEQQAIIIDNCLSIESEWILDPDVRREASMIQWDED